MSKIASLEIARLPVEQLRPHPRNPRVHAEPGSPAWVALEKSLAHEYFDPLVWNSRNGCLVSGHFRAKILAHQGFSEIDCVVVDYDEPTHYAKMVAANRQFGEWDESALSDLLGEISESGLDGALAGFVEQDWLSVVQPEAPQLDAADVPDVDPAVDDHAEQLMSIADELQQKWQVEKGDLYSIAGGKIRLFCGDTTLASTWKTLLNGEKVDLVWTDPPYNIAYNTARPGPASARKQDTLENDDLPTEEFQNLLDGALTRAYENAKSGASIYVAHAETIASQFLLAMHRAGWSHKQTIVWVKQHFTLSRCDYKPQHEPILYGWKLGAAHTWRGGFCQSTVTDDEKIEKMSESDLRKLVRQLLNDRATSIVREARDPVQHGHPTVKPLALVARHIANSCPDGGLVIDCFAGSGTTLLAAHHLGMRAAAPEIDPKFCAVVLQRAADAGLKIEKITEK